MRKLKITILFLFVLIIFAGCQSTVDLQDYEVDTLDELNELENVAILASTEDAIYFNNSDPIGGRYKSLKFDLKTREITTEVDSKYYELKEMVVFESDTYYIGTYKEKDYLLKQEHNSLKQLYQSEMILSDLNSYHDLVYLQEITPNSQRLLALEDHQLKVVLEYNDHRDLINSKEIEPLEFRDRSFFNKVKYNVDNIETLETDVINRLNLMAYDKLFNEGEIPENLLGSIVLEDYVVLLANDSINLYNIKNNTNVIIDNNHDIEGYDMVHMGGNSFAQIDARNFPAKFINIYEVKDSETLTIDWRQIALNDDVFGNKESLIIERINTINQMILSSHHDDQIYYQILNLKN